MTMTASEKQHKAYRAAMTAVIVEAGGLLGLGETRPEEWVIPVTRAGGLHLGIWAPTSYDRSGVTGVWGRFDYPAVAVAILGEGRVNPCTGKWNHHWGEGETVEGACVQMRHELAALQVVTGKSAPGDTPCSAIDVTRRQA